ncbi:hypothetical protein E3N88_20445 [Mikania micrantha]|uniref:GYF domain-containing protein n=1 Tax=Mikania micrantha TaxID=192012 RepID=A0A5N6NH26_9ASTR|nr:hypothetical protein E3N88_20445 [Mikania micrantha]
MGMVNEGSLLRYPTHLQTEPVNLGGDDTVPRSLRRRERRRGHVRSGADECGEWDDDTLLAHTLNTEDEYPPVSESEDEQLYDMYDSEVLEHAWDYGKHEDDTFNGEFHNPYDDEQDSDWSNDDY